MASIQWPSNSGENLALSITFDHSVGAKTCKIFNNANVCTLFIPALSWSDGLGTAVLAAASSITSGLRPAVAVKFPYPIINDGTAAIGSIILGSDGSITLYSTAGTGTFTNAAAGSAPASCLTYNLA